MQNPKEIYTVKMTETFDKSAERLLTKKKFTKLPEQIEKVIQELRSGDFEGNILKKNINPAYTVYKKRLPNLDTKAGKSNGYRLIYIVMHDFNVVGLLEIYYKKETETLSDAYIEGLIDWFILELEDSEQSYQ